MPRARLNCSALRAARLPFDAPLVLRPAAWDSDVELPDEAPDAPAFIAEGVALLEVHGPLSREPDRLCGWWDGYLGEDGIAARFERAIQHAATRAVLLHFLSPGGTSAGLGEGLARMLRARVTAAKPVLGYVEEACSAAYWIGSSVCDGGLFAREDGEAGSIGSFIPHQSIAAMLEKEGTAMTLVADPPGKVAGNPYQPLDDVGRARIERAVKACTGRFMRDVEASRGIPEKALRELDGDILEGFDAVNARLLDGVADLETTVSLALAMADERARKAS